MATHSPCNLIEQQFYPEWCKLHGGDVVTAWYVNSTAAPILTFGSSWGMWHTSIYHMHIYVSIWVYITFISGLVMLNRLNELNLGLSDDGRLFPSQDLHNIEYVWRRLKTKMHLFIFNMFYNDMIYNRTKIQSHLLLLNKTIFSYNMYQGNYIARSHCVHTIFTNAW